MSLRQWVPDTYPFDTQTNRTKQLPRVRIVRAQFRNGILIIILLICAFAKIAAGRWNSGPPRSRDWLLW